MSGVDPSLDSQPQGQEPSSTPDADALWRGILLGTDSRYRDSYELLRRLPGSPRCYMCSAPFKGAGSIVARRMGRKPWAKNPHYCQKCFVLMENQRGGAEIDCSLLFADVRGSTALAETMRPSDFMTLMNRFYEPRLRLDQPVPPLRRAHDPAPAPQRTALSPLRPQPAPAGQLP